MKKKENNIYHLVGRTQLHKGNVKAMTFDEFSKAYQKTFKSRNLEDIYKACGGDPTKKVTEK